MATPFLNLTLPTPSVTIGPLWATQINAAFDTIDLHDHTSGKGVLVPTSGLNINANLNFAGYKPYALLSTQFTSQVVALSGATHANSVYVNNDNLYFVNGSGLGVQITSGGAIIATPSAAQTFDVQDVTSNLVIGSGDAFVYLTVDTSAARTITLPLAAAVSEGRIYIIKDKTGSARAFPITILASGADTIDATSSITLNSDLGTWMIIGDGSTKYYLS
jgi:hypothetical protein